jgi:parallel beta-helix repeat protein
MAPESAYAQVSCGQTITTNTALTGDLNCGTSTAAGIKIGANGITLDCNGHTITGSGGPYGISLVGRTGVTVENCYVSHWANGFTLGSSSTLVKCTASSNGYGFVLSGSDSNTLMGDLASNNFGDGFLLMASSSGNTLRSNTAEGNFHGFSLESSNGNVLTGNTANSNGASGNGYGFYVSSSSSNTLSSNKAISNGYGFYVSTGSSGNTISGNAANSNQRYGYYDQTSGSGTAGTANTYTEDTCSGNTIACSSPPGV